VAGAYKGGRRIANPPQVNNLPHMAASRNEWWRCSAVVAGAYKGGRRIANPPQAASLPHRAASRNEW
jgi:hypothetical protein